MRLIDSFRHSHILLADEVEKTQTIRSEISTDSTPAENHPAVRCFEPRGEPR